MAPYLLMFTNIPISCFHFGTTLTSCLPTLISHISLNTHARLTLVFQSDFSSVFPVWLNQTGFHQSIWKPIPLAASHTPYPLHLDSRHHQKVRRNSRGQHQLPAEFIGDSQHSRESTWCNGDEILWKPWSHSCQAFWLFSVTSSSSATLRQVVMNWWK